MKVFGYHMGPNYHGNRLLDLYGRGKTPAVALTLLDNREGIPELIHQHPETMIIARRWWAGNNPNGDDNAQDYMEGDAYMDGLVTFYGKNKDAYYYVGNEPTPATLQDKLRLVEFLEKAVKYAVDYGYKIVIGNFSVGNPSTADITGVLSPIFRLVEKYDNVYLGMHDYGAYRGRRPDGSPDVFFPNKAAEIVQHFPGCFNKIILTEVGLDRLVQFPNSGSWKKVRLTDEEYADVLHRMYVDYWRFAGVIGACVFFWDTDEHRWGDYNMYRASAFQNRVLQTDQLLVLPPTTGDDDDDDDDTPPSLPPEIELDDIEDALTELVSIINEIKAALSSIDGAFSLVINNTTESYNLATQLLDKIQELND